MVRLVFVFIFRSLVRAVDDSVVLRLLVDGSVVVRMLVFSSILRLIVVASFAFVFGRTVVLTIFLFVFVGIVLSMIACFVVRKQLCDLILYSELQQQKFPSKFGHLGLSNKVVQVNIVTTFLKILIKMCHYVI